MAAKRRARYLIVNADDFGQSPGVNRGIIEAHEHGIVTSASLMVHWPAAAQAAVYSRKHNELSLGIHFDFSEWACRRGSWLRLYQVVPDDDVEGIAREASRQLATFRRLVGRDPTHVDSHQHAHRGRGVRPIFAEIAGRLGVPLRGCDSQISYCGHFYGQTSNGRLLHSFVGVRALIGILEGLRPGFTELGCHPGKGNDLDSMYVRERALEVKTLCDPRVRAAINDLGIELRSFHGALASRELVRHGNQRSQGAMRERRSAA